MHKDEPNEPLQGRDCLQTCGIYGSKNVGPPDVAHTHPCGCSFALEITPETVYPRSVHFDNNCSTVMVKRSAVLVVAVSVVVKVQNKFLHIWSVKNLDYGVGRSSPFLPHYKRGMI